MTDYMSNIGDLLLVTDVSTTSESSEESSSDERMYADLVMVLIGQFCREAIGVVGLSTTCLLLMKVTLCCPNLPSPQKIKLIFGGWVALTAIVFFFLVLN